MTSPSETMAVQPPLIDRLMAARQAFGGSGNRRRLFARFDEVLDSFASEESEIVQPSISSPDSHSAFQFRRIELANWKAFEHVEISFPRFEVARPVALIGGDNGNGKTSILDAILTGLFGLRRFLDLNANMLSGPSSETHAVSRRAEYGQHLERAIHRPAFDRGERMIVISLELDTDNGPFAVERRWYFDDAGRFHEADEELVLRTGEDRDILPVPLGEDAMEFYQRQISERLVPPSMAPFFLFDGEQIRRLSERDLGDQVRFGIEAALGIGVFRGLAADLNDFARDRGRDLQADDTEAKLSTRVAQLETEHANAQHELASIEAKLEPLRRRRDQIVETIGSIGTGTYEARREELEFRHDAEARLRALRHDLVTSATRSLPIALAGTDLLEATATELAFVMTAESWAPPTHENNELEKLLKAIADTSPQFAPDVEKAFAQRMRTAWEGLNQPAVSGVGTELHSYLGGHRVDRVYDSLAQSRDTAVPTVMALLKQISELKVQIDRVEDSVTARRNADQTREALRAELDSLNAEIGTLEMSRRSLDQMVGRLVSQLEPQRADWQRRRVQRRTAAPALHRVEAAAEIAKSIGTAIQAAVPLHYTSLAERVTSSYRALAYKRVVERIDILPSGEVRLMDGTGRNIRDADPSAGESQVFAMALIAAVLDLGGSAIPLVIDTPLGRLDPEHRERMLDFFVRRPTQTILLSQPEEVGGVYYERIAHRLAAEYRLSYRYRDGDLGATVIEQGYFPRRAA